MNILLQVFFSQRNVSWDNIKTEFAAFLVGSIYVISCRTQFADYLEPVLSSWCWASHSPESTSRNPIPPYQYKSKVLFVKGTVKLLFRFFWGKSKLRHNKTDHVFRFIYSFQNRQKSKKSVSRYPFEQNRSHLGNRLLISGNWVVATLLGNTSTLFGNPEYPIFFFILKKPNEIPLKCYLSRYI